MATLAKLMVVLGLDASEMTRGLDEAAGQAEASVSRFSKLGGLMKTGLAVGAGAAVVGVGLAAKGLVDVTREAMAAEEIQAQLNAVLESTGGAAGVTAAGANDLADSLSKMTRFDDETILGAEAMMLTFTKVSDDVFPAAIEAALDMSTAMGTDLNSAVLQIGKALQDPIDGVTALKRVGVDLDDQQRDLIKTMVEAGDTAGAQALILQELQTEFGNSATAAGDTFAGQLDILKNGLGNVKEQIGTALLPALSDLLEQIGPGIVEAAGKAATFITDTLIPAFSDAGRWLSENLPKALETAKQFWTQTLLPALTVVWDFIEVNILPVLQTLGDWLSVNIPQAVQTASDIWQNALLPALTVVWDFIEANIIPVLQTIGEWMSVNIPEAVQTGSDIWRNVLLPALTEVWAFIQDPLMPIFTALADLFTSVIGVAVAAFGAVWRTVLLPAIQLVDTFIRNNLLPVFETLRRWAQDTFPPIFDALGQKFDLVKDAVKKLWEFIARNLLAVFQTLYDKAQELGERYTWFKDYVLAPVQAAFGAIRDMIQFVIEKFEAMKAALSNFSLPGWISSLAEKLDGIINKLKQVGGGAAAGATQGAGNGAGGAVGQAQINIGAAPVLNMPAPVMRMPELRTPVINMPAPVIRMAEIRTPKVDMPAPVMRMPEMTAPRRNMPEMAGAQRNMVTNNSTTNGPTIVVNIPAGVREPVEVRRQAELGVLAGMRAVGAM